MMAPNVLPVLAALGLSLIVACGVTPPPAGDGDPAAGGDPSAAGDPAAPGDPGQDADTDGPCPNGEPSNMSFQEKTREASAGNTAIAVTLVSLECVGTPSELVFRISMTNHTCSIPGYNLDFEQHVSLSTSDGLTFSDGFAYDVLSADDHHPLGVLTVAAQRSGSPIIGCGTQSLSLEIVDIDQAPGESVSLTWTGSVLDGIRDCP